PSFPRRSSDLTRCAICAPRPEKPPTRRSSGRRRRCPRPAARAEQRDPVFFQKDEERIRRRAQRTTSTEPAPGAQRPLPVLRQGPRCRNARPERNTGGGSAQRTNAAARPATRSFGQRPEPSTAVAAGQVLERSSAAPMPDRDLPVEHELAAAIL